MAKDSHLLRNLSLVVYKSHIVFSPRRRRNSNSTKLSLCNCRSRASHNLVSLRNRRERRREPGLWGCDCQSLLLLSLRSEAIVCRYIRQPNDFGPTYNWVGHARSVSYWPLGSAKISSTPLRRTS